MKTKKKMEETDRKCLSSMKSGVMSAIDVTKYSYEQMNKEVLAERRIVNRTEARKLADLGKRNLEVAKAGYEDLKNWMAEFDTEPQEIEMLDHLEVLLTGLDKVFTGFVAAFLDYDKA